MTQLRHALVRHLPRSYREFYAAQHITIDMALADAQHAAYVAALEMAGLDLMPIPADESLPDCVFIEDTAVVWGTRALVTRMVPRREGEQRGVVAHLRTTHEIITLPDGARLEGGDVLHTDDITYVGLTQRTNAEGVKALTEFLSPSKRSVVAVPCARCLHLKTAATYLGNNTLLTAPGLIDEALFRNINDIITTPDDESHAANSIRIGDHLVVQAGYPDTERLLRAFASNHGVAVLPVDTSEFAKGDGSLTCLSIIL